LLLHLYPNLQALLILVDATLFILAASETDS
jgi:hypothetical protein